MTGDEPQHADIVISIKSENMDKIVSRLKTHEFRKYIIPKTVRRLWFYTMAPTQELQYIGVIGQAKEPGGIDRADNGIGNVEFNTGQMDASYAYEILHLYELEEPFSFYELKEYEFLRAPPPSAKYQWAKGAMLEYIRLNEQKQLF